MSVRPREGVRVVDAADRLGATLGETDVADVIERCHTASRGNTP